MTSINKTLRGLSEIHMNQTPRVTQAANQAHRRNQTRATRAYQKVGATITAQINKRSPA